MGTRHDLSFCACTTVCLVSESPASMGPRPHLWVLIAKQRLLDQHTSLYGYQNSPVVLCMQNSVISSRITRLYGFQPSSVVLCIQNSDFRTRLTSLFGYQTSSVVLSIHNSVLSTRINRLYWFQPSPAVLCMQNSVFWTRTTSLYRYQTWPVVLWMYIDDLSIRITCLYGSPPSSVFFGCTTATLEQKNKSLCVPDMKCPFVHAKQRDSARITSLYWFQPSSVVLCIQKSDFRTRIACLYGS